ncbi:ABC transporter ATP-binding protein [Lagierella sp.]|uniref:ABC transporter ATP-binding protein n=1 Tax=Lagierella sp. TaxID=2849657 RepID=UPI00262473AF|nr:ABC transporter ATP-binding protein [Lagierella sp.]
MKKLVEVKNLSAKFPGKEFNTYAVNNISFDIYENETLGIVGESGSGKSVTAKSILNLLKGRAVYDGEIIYKGINLLKADEKTLRNIRGNEISMIFQDPMTSLNPLFTIEKQMYRLIKRHRKNLNNKEIKELSIKYLDLVGIPDAENRISGYPHEFSGGMKQRVMIAMSLCLDPKLIIADEPTTALDVTIQAQVLTLLNRLNKDSDQSTLLITHDLGVVANTCDRVIVLYGGIIMEEATIEEIFENSLNPYTKGLLQSLPKIGKKERLIPIPGNPPVLIEKPKGCPFYDRCKLRGDICKRQMPPEKIISPTHKVYCHMIEE